LRNFPTAHFHEFREAFQHVAMVVDVTAGRWLDHKV